MFTLGLQNITNVDIAVFAINLYLKNICIIKSMQIEENGEKKCL